MLSHSCLDGQLTAFVLQLQQKNLHGQKSTLWKTGLILNIFLLECFVYYIQLWNFSLFSKSLMVVSIEMCYQYVSSQSTTRNATLCNNTIICFTLLHFENFNISRGLYITQLNIYDGAFFTKAVKYIHKKAKKLFAWVLNTSLLFEDSSNSSSSKYFKLLDNSSSMLLNI